MRSRTGRPTGRIFFGWLILAVAVLAGAAAEATTTKTSIVDVLYRADGTPAQGTLLISWPAFTTAGGDAIAAGSMTVKLGSGGSVQAAVFPNTGSTPQGTYYKVLLDLDDGTRSTEYWVVPQVAQTTIAAVRSLLVPQSQAMQFVGRDYVDSAIAGVVGSSVGLAGNQAIAGVKTFQNSPQVPAPTNAGDAANRQFVLDTLSNSASTTAAGQSTPGPVNATLYQIDGVALSSANLSDGATLAKVSQIPTLTSELTNNSGFITGAGAPVQSVNGMTGAVSLTIPAAQVNSDWNATSGAAKILNKPALGSAAAQNTSAFDAAGAAAAAAAVSLPLAGGTLTGTLNGTSASFSGNLAVGSATSGVGSITLKDSTWAHSFTLQAPSAFTASYTLTLPSTLAAGCLYSDAYGNGSFVACSGWPGGTASGIPNYSYPNAWNSSTPVYNASNPIPAAFIALPSTVVQTNQANAYSSELQDFSGASLKQPASYTVGSNTITNPTSAGTLALTSAIPTSSSWPNAGSCTSGQYETASTNGSAPTCAQVQYSQLGGTVPTWNQNTTGTAAGLTNGTVHILGFQYGQPGGSAISTGILGYQTIPIGCTLTGWNMVVDAGTATVKTLKVASGTAIPTLGSNSISTSGVAISTGTVIESTTLTDFTTTTFTAKDIVAADLITVSSVGFIDFELVLSCAQ
jgi:hypothetical protein